MFYLDEKTIREAVEEAYLVPFEVGDLKNVLGLTSFTIAPSDSLQELFLINFSFKEGFSLRLTVKPENHARRFVDSLSAIGIEKQTAFCDFLKLFLRDKATVSTEVNGNEIDLIGEPWPESWNSFQFKIKKAFSFDDDVPDDAKRKVVLSWLIRSIGLALSLCDIEPDFPTDDLTAFGKPEGYVKTVSTKRYERNRVNRILCIEAHGTNCNICGFDFEKKYGELGKGFIHVHHIVPVSEIEPGYLIDPVADLIPVCPNCHGMLHRRNPPLTPEELKAIISVSASSKDNN